MALRKVYNSPPNWPAPPEGWQPPPGWRSDPAWGPAPDGWEFWRQERANPLAFAIAAAASGALLVVFLGLGTIVARRPPTPYVFGLVLGRCLVMWIVTGIIAFVSTHRWRWWLYLLVALGASLVLGALTTIGHQNTG